MNGSEAGFILLFVIATAVAIAARRFRVPYTVALVVTGLALGALHALEPPHLTRELVFAVFLPGLLFEAAFHLEFKAFRADAGPIVGLAVPGVIAALGLTALILAPVVRALELEPSFTWVYALLFGAVVAATDPIAVVGLFKSLGAPKRLSVLVEGESLLNDGTAIVLFTLIVGLAAGAHESAAALALDFIRVVGIGGLVGLVIGLLVSEVVKRVDDPMIEITLTTIAAYGSFVMAEQLHCSGVIATVVAGMLCGNYAARAGMSPSTRIAAESFWEYVAFALNSIVFLLIGFEVSLRALAASWQAILVAYLAVLVGRAIVVGGVTGLLRASRDPIPSRWAAVLTWGGLRGSLSMVLVLGLPLGFAHRDLLVTMTFGVVILSILVQGTSMSPLLRRLGLLEADQARADYDRLRTATQAAHAALAELDEMARRRSAPADLLDALREEYRDRAGRAEEEARSLHLQKRHLQEEEAKRARRHLLLVEKQHVLDALQRGVLRQDAFEGLMADIDARLWRLEAGEEDRV
jgi:CPA1 family monovalent cation:H+ antiporter